MITRIREFICRHFHGRPMHPHRGHYTCRVCLRRWPVAWDINASTKPLPTILTGPRYAR